MHHIIVRHDRCAHTFMSAITLAAIIISGRIDES